MEEGLFWLIIQGDSLYHKGSEGEAVDHIVYTNRKQREMKSNNPTFPFLFGVEPCSWDIATYI